MSTLAAGSSGLLVDSNLLVLFVVGSVNRDRIDSFKRTSKYTKADYDLLLRVFRNFTVLHTLPHVMAEVSNLTDLPGKEAGRARDVLKSAISLLDEHGISSASAAEDALYPKLGLVDAAIGAVARAHKCTVLTDDLDLYLLLARQQVEVVNFSHLRAQTWGL